MELIKIKQWNTYRKVLLMKVKDLLWLGIIYFLSHNENIKLVKLAVNEMLNYGFQNWETLIT